MDKKQTAMQTLIEWADKMILEHSMKKLSFAEAIDKAVELLEMEKEQIMDAYGVVETTEQGDIMNAEQYYNETYG